MLDFKVKIGLVPDVRDLFDFATRKGIFEPAKGVESNPSKILRREEIQIRDPFILVDDDTYYLYGTQNFGSFNVLQELEAKSRSMRCSLDDTGDIRHYEAGIVKINNAQIRIDRREMITCDLRL